VNLYYVRYCIAWYLVGRTALTLAIRGKLNFETLAIVCYYNTGCSLEEVARNTRTSPTTVRKQLVAAGIRIRTLSEAALLSSVLYPVPRQRQAGKYLAARGRDGKYCAIHRACWEAHYPLHPGFHVHHIDGNTLNNDMSNLAALAPGIHRQVHAEEARRALEAYRAQEAM
jgi:hypothetical protein